MRRFLLALLFLPFLASPASAQRLVGRVTDAATGAGIPFAEVQAELAGSVPLRTFSDSAGTFTLRMNTGAGRYRVSARHIAYAPSTAEVVLGEQDQLEVVVRLAVTAIELPPLEVVARSRAPDPFLEQVGYYERKSARFGVFIDPEEIERRRPLQTSDLFRNISGVRVFSLGGVRGNDIRITRAEDPRCPPRTYIDRVMVRRGERQIEIGDTPLDQLIQPTLVYAIEVFRSPSEVPVEFGGPNASCGVVVIWTKRGTGR